MIGNSLVPLIRWMAICIQYALGPIGYTSTSTSRLSPSSLVFTLLSTGHEPGERGGKINCNDATHIIRIYRKLLFRNDNNRSILRFSSACLEWISFFALFYFSAFLKAHLMLIIIFYAVVLTYARRHTRLPTSSSIVRTASEREKRRFIKRVERKRNERTRRQPDLCQ